MPSYAEQAALLTDQTWGGRVDACIRQEALKFANDSRPEFTGLAHAVIADPLNLPVTVRSLVAGQPEMAADSDDQAILSAVDAVWPQAGLAYTGDAVP